MPNQPDPNIQTRGCKLLFILIKIQTCTQLHDYSRIVTECFWTTLWSLAQLGLVLAVVSPTQMLATDPLNPVIYEIRTPRIRCSCDAGLDWDLGNLVAKSNLHTGCPQTIPEPFLLCDRKCCPVERGHRLHRMFLWKWFTWFATKPPEVCIL